MNSFGKRRVGRPRKQMEFGASQCHPLTALGQEQCESYMDGSDYPCYWRLPKAQDCWGRNDRQPRNVRYQHKTSGLPPPIMFPAGFKLPPPPLPPRPVGYVAPNRPPRGLYECTGRTQSTCGSNPNCTWAGKRKCIRRPGHLAGTQYEGPLGPMGFGKKRYNVPGSVCNKQLKKICRSNPNCTYTTRGCRRRSGTKKGVVFEGPSLAFGKMCKSVTADIKALMAM